MGRPGMAPGQGATFPLSYLYTLPSIDPLQPSLIDSAGLRARLRRRQLTSIGPSATS
jgi:hypothetical protein